MNCTNFVGVHFDFEGSSFGGSTEMGIHTYAWSNRLVYRLPPNFWEPPRESKKVVTWFRISTPLHPFNYLHLVV